MRNFTATIILFLILMAMGSFYFLYLKNQPARTERQQTSQKIKLIEEKDLAKALIEEISLTFPDKELILRKEEKMWKIDNDLANNEKVNEYLDKIFSLDSDKAVSNTNESEFGFTTPQLEISLKSINKELHLLFGNSTPTQDKIYVKNQQIIIINKSAFEELKKDKSDFK